MVTGRSVSRTIRDCVVVSRRRSIYDHQRLHTSTLAIHTNGHGRRKGGGVLGPLELEIFVSNFWQKRSFPELRVDKIKFCHFCPLPGKIFLATPGKIHFAPLKKSFRRPCQRPSRYSHTPHPSLYVGDFNWQQFNWGYNKTSSDGESLDSWATSSNLGLLYDQKETASFSSHRWNVGTNPDVAFTSFCQDSRLPGRRVLGKFLRPQHRPFLITPPRLKVPAHRDPVKCWNFGKDDWKRFCLLTGESVERLPPPDTLNIYRAYQVCYPRPNNVSHVAAARTMCYVGTKSARPSIAPSSKPQWGLPLIELLRSYYLG